MSVKYIPEDVTNHVTCTRKNEEKKRDRGRPIKRPNSKYISNVGTYNTTEVLEEWRRVCIVHSLLHKEDQMLVTNLLQPMPQTIPNCFGMV